MTALRLLGAERIALVDPPWFGAALNDRGRAYYRAAGFDVVYAASAELPSNQRMITPAELYEWVLQNVPDDAQAVTIGGNGFRAVGVIQALENELGRPVLTANQVLLWAALAAAGAQPGLVNGYGRVYGLS